MTMTLPPSGVFAQWQNFYQKSLLLFEGLFFHFLQDCITQIKKYTKRKKYTPS